MGAQYIWKYGLSGSNQLVFTACDYQMVQVYGSDTRGLLRRVARFGDEFQPCCSIAAECEIAAGEG